MVSVDCRYHAQVRSILICVITLLTVIFSVTDWFFFLVLDIGNPAIADIPVGVRVIIGFLQATAVRAAGFGTVALAALAPAVKYVFVRGPV